MTTRRSIETPTAVAEPTPEVVTRPDLFDGITLRSPLLQLAKQALAPFLQHGTDCVGPECTCGLRAALVALQHRENIVTRYGSTE